MEESDKPISNGVKDVFEGLDKNLITLSNFLKYSIASLVYGTNKNDFKQCICTLNIGLIKQYNKKLNNDVDSALDKLDSIKYNEADTKIVVYDLVEGKKSTINLKDKKWGIASHLVLSKENIEDITEFIKKTWPKKTTILQKEKGTKLK